MQSTEFVNLSQMRKIKNSTYKKKKKELMLLNCGVGEDFWESFGLQGHPASPS